MLGPMNTLQLQSLMLIFAGWVNRRQDVIEYPQEENRVLRGQVPVIPFRETVKGKVE